MSYLVLARKYRPANFAEMVGQDHVVRALTNALKTQRLHHAYLFTGTRGVGKTTVSRILAKSLNCVGPDGTGGITDQPCGVCQACRDIDAGRFVDYVELDAASNRGVDEISQLLEQSVYKPVVGRFKVFMIDEVHMLSNTAFNAMLKTLEEPPEYLKFVLATTDPQKVPVTVLSRCLQFNLRPMAPETVFEHLQQVLACEQLQFDTGSLRLLSRAAHGSMRDALSLTDQAIAYGNGTIEENAVRQMLGSVDRSHVYKLIGALASGDGKSVVELVDFMRMQGLSAAAALEEMGNVLQRMAVLRVVPDMAQPDDQDDAAVMALVPLMGADEVQLLYSIVLRGSTELGLASDEYAALVMILLRLLAFKPQGEDVNMGKGGSSFVPKSEKPQQAQTLNQVPLNIQQTASQSWRTDNVPEPFSGGARVQKVQNSNKAQEPHQPQSVPVQTDKPVPAAGGMPKIAESAGRLVDTAHAKGNYAGIKATDQQAKQIQEIEAGDDMPPWLDEVPSQGVDAIGAPSTAPLQTPFAMQHNERPNSGQASGQAFASYVLSDVATTGLSGNGHTACTQVDLPPATPLTQRWVNVVNAMLKQDLLKALARELVLNSQVQSVNADETLWELCCARKTLLTPANQQKVTAALQGYLGRAVELVFAEGEVADTPALRILAGEQQKQAQAQQDAAADPVVQKLLNQFPDARIIPGSVKPV